MTHLQDIYQKRATQFAQIAAELKEKYNRFSFIRLIVFFVAVFLVIFLFAQFNALIGIVFCVLFLFGFSKFVFWHRDILNTAEHHQFLAVINEEEIAALKHEYQNFAAGEQFIDPDHPNTVDMDIFGAYSLFQYCNRTSTAIGQTALANFLSRPTSKEDILARQIAIKELGPKLEWRQNFQATGRDTKDNTDHLRLLNLWLSDEPFVNNNKWLKIALVLVPIWMVIGMGLSMYLLSWPLAIFFVLLPGIILSRTTEKVNETHVRTTHAEKMLSYYAKLIQHIEETSFSAPKLQALKANFSANEQQASQQIQRLSYIIGQLNVRYNAFAILFNLAGLWDLQYVRKLEKWKAQNKAVLPDWFAGLQEFEALNSLATLHYNNPTWIFPSIAEEVLLNGKALGHPLIHHSKRITNDFHSPTQAHIKLVTGSNMAGKSTFLRTVGVNIILAMAGAAVCAKEFSLPILQVYTSMRTQDCLLYTSPSPRDRTRSRMPSSA